MSVGVIADSYVASGGSGGGGGYAAAVLTDGPLAYYRLGGSSTTVLPDSSGNARDGAFEGAIPTHVAGLLTGDADGAVNFANGAKGFIAKAAWMDVSYVTVEAVVKPDALFSSMGIVDRDQNGTRSFQFRLDGSKLQFIIWTTTSAAFFVTGTTTFVAGQTYHVAATFDGTTAKVYVNGAVDGSAALGGTMRACTDRLTVGRGDQNSTFSGTVDEAAYYGAALSAARLAAHAAAVTGA